MVTGMDCRLCSKLFHPAQNKIFSVNTNIFYLTHQVEVSGLKVKLSFAVDISAWNVCRVVDGESDHSDIGIKIISHVGSSKPGDKDDEVHEDIKDEEFT